VHGELDVASGVGRGAGLRVSAGLLAGHGVQRVHAGLVLHGGQAAGAVPTRQHVTAAEHERGGLHVRLGVHASGDVTVSMSHAKTNILEMSKKAATLVLVHMHFLTRVNARKTAQPLLSRRVREEVDDEDVEEHDEDAGDGGGHRGVGREAVGEDVDDDEHHELHERGGVLPEEASGAHEHDARVDGERGVDAGGAELLEEAGGRLPDGVAI